MTLDVPSLRADTPGVANVLIDAVTDHLSRAVAIGGVEAMVEAADSAADFYDSIATLIGAQADEIAFAESATRAWDMAFYAIPFRQGDRVITGRGLDAVVRASLHYYNDESGPR